MNKENAHLFLPLVQALADGKTIQYIENGIWNDMFGDSIAFGNHFEHYRIKPEPREFYVYRDNFTDGVFYAKEGLPLADWKEVIRVREILD
jgi:hypothetical protein